MKKIPNWVSIQQSVQEANHFTTYKSKHELVDWLYATGRLIISIGWHCQYVDATPKWAVATGSKKKLNRFIWWLTGSGFSFCFHLGMWSNDQTIHAQSNAAWSNQTCGGWSPLHQRKIRKWTYLCVLYSNEWITADLFQRKNHKKFVHKPQRTNFFLGFGTSPKSIP